MTEDWVAACTEVGFKRHGDFGGMRLLMDDMEFFLIPNGLGHLEMRGELRVDRPRREYTMKLPLTASAQQIAQAVVTCFEREHPV